LNIHVLEEEILKAKHSDFYKVKISVRNNDSIDAIQIEISPFWLKNRLRFSFLTAVLKGFKPELWKSLKRSKNIPKTLANKVIYFKNGEYAVEKLNG